jgi:hypothetical protein
LWDRDSGRLLNANPERGVYYSEYPVSVEHRIALSQTFIGQMRELCAASISVGKPIVL